MFELLQEICQRPEPFSRYTAKELWTRPWLAQQMLQFHLDQETALASSPIVVIEQAVNWIDRQTELSGKRVCDLGCGAGLYAQRFAGKGATVCGVDFSANSIEYAKSQDDQSIHYILADYLSDELPSGFDVVTLIYTDFCALSPEQRSALLDQMRKMLNPNGQIVLDVVGVNRLSQMQEQTEIEDRMMGGFWAEGEYVGIKRTSVYPNECVSLDRYLIVEPDETWQIFNWMQYFSAESIETELTAAGFTVDHMAGDLTGTPLKPESDLIGVIARVV